MTPTETIEQHKGSGKLRHFWERLCSQSLFFSFLKHPCHRRAQWKGTILLTKETNCIVLHK